MTVTYAAVGIGFTLICACPIAMGVGYAILISRALKSEAPGEALRRIWSATDYRALDVTAGWLIYSAATAGGVGCLTMLAAVLLANR